MNLMKNLQWHYFSSAKFSINDFFRKITLYITFNNLVLMFWFYIYWYFWLFYDYIKTISLGRVFQVALVVKNLPDNAQDARNLGSIHGLEWSPGGGHGNPLQYSFLENPMDKGAWKATVHRFTKSQTRLKWLSTYAHKLRICTGSFKFIHMYIMFNKSKC